MQLLALLRYNDIMKTTKAFLKTELKTVDDFPFTSKEITEARLVMQAMGALLQKLEGEDLYAMESAILLCDRFETHVWDLERAENRRLLKVKSST